MPDENIKRLFDKLEVLQRDVTALRVEVKHLDETVKEKNEEDKIRDRHIHQLEIAKNRAYAITSFCVVITGLILTAVSLFK